MYKEHAEDLAKKIGPGTSLLQRTYWAANKITDLLIVHGMSLTMDTVDRSYLDQARGCSWGFVDQDTLLRSLGQGTSEDMDETFIRRALRRGDRCHAAMVGGKIVSYGWYSTLPTPVTDELLLRFDSDYAYMYKGYTLPEYRGKRLHGMGMARAMAAHVLEGKKGLVSYVEVTNAPSLKSCALLGYQKLGLIVAVRVGPRFVVHSSRGCEACGLRVEPVIP